MKAEQIKDLTGFELFLMNEGFSLLHATNTYLNTYNSCFRTWGKGNKMITIGLMDSPCRIGIPFAPIVDNENTEKYTYLPTEQQYKEYLNILTNGKA